ncbi:MAG: Uma2 family endonuclease [Blastocatellia bacterium]|nr:Uma2 family endonuclease [Blastocatellia bacterium]
MSSLPQKRLFTVAEYYRMAEAGVLTQQDRVELIEGEIVRMSPIGSRHAGRLNRLLARINAQLNEEIIVSVQNPLRISDFSEPEPDMAVLKYREDYYTESHPTPQDTLLVIELSDTTLAYDRKTKVPLYARAGIPEVWILDLNTDTIEVFNEPVRGKYKTRKSFQRGETLVSPQLPKLHLTVDEIFG